MRKFPSLGIVLVCKIELAWFHQVIAKSMGTNTLDAWVQFGTFVNNW